MSLAPTITVTLGNLRYDSHAVDLRGTLGMLPVVNHCRVTLPAGVRLDALPGDPAILEIDGGEGAATLLTGKVRALRRGLLGTAVDLSDAGADLAALRPAATYERQNGGDIVRALASDAAVSLGSVDLDLPLVAYVAHQNMTAAEHITYLAQLGGALAYVDGDGDLQVMAQDKEQPEVALLYGREIIAYEVKEQALPPVRRVMAGSGPAGSPEAPDALRQTLAALPGDAPAPGADAVWQPAAVLRTPMAAKNASAAAEVAAAAPGVELRAHCFLLPELRPGTVIEVQELPGELSGGPWLITRVLHRIRPDLGGQTIFSAHSAGSATSLFGAALSAIGGLL